MYVTWLIIWYPFNLIQVKRDNSVLFCAIISRVISHYIIIYNVHVLFYAHVSSIPEERGLLFNANS
jgi:hypothetical protein